LYQLKKQRSLAVLAGAEVIEVPNGFTIPQTQISYLLIPQNKYSLEGKPFIEECVEVLSQNTLSFAVLFADSSKKGATRRVVAAGDETSVLRVFRAVIRHYWDTDPTVAQEGIFMKHPQGGNRITYRSDWYRGKLITETQTFSVTNFPNERSFKNCVLRYGINEIRYRFLMVGQDLDNTNPNIDNVSILL
jgi:hypothetical protein